MKEAPLWQMDRGFRKTNPVLAELVEHLPCKEVPGMNQSDTCMPVILTPREGKWKKESTT